MLCKRRVERWIALTLIPIPMLVERSLPAIVEKHVVASTPSCQAPYRTRSQKSISKPVRVRVRGR